MSNSGLDFRVQSFNLHCLWVWDKVASTKAGLDHLIDSSPCMNDRIPSFKQTCHGIEYSQVQNHHFILLSTLNLNNMLKDARATYFSHVISNFWRNSKILFDTISNIGSLTITAVPVSWWVQELLSIFVGKINYMSKHHSLYISTLVFLIPVRQDSLFCYGCIFN